MTNFAKDVLENLFLYVFVFLFLLVSDFLDINPFVGLVFVYGMLFLFDRFGTKKTLLGLFCFVCPILFFMLLHHIAINLFVGLLILFCGLSWQMFFLFKNFGIKVILIPIFLVFPFCIRMFPPNSQDSVRIIVTILYCGTIGYYSIYLQIKELKNLKKHMLIPVKLATIFFIGSVIYHFIPGGIALYPGRFLILTFIIPIFLILKGAFGALIGGFSLCSVIVSITNDKFEYIEFWHEILLWFGERLAFSISPWFEWIFVCSVISFNFINWNISSVIDDFQ